MTDVKELRKFGLLFGGVIGLVFGVAMPLWRRGEIFLPAVIVGAIFFLAGVVYPRILFYPQKLWLKVGEILGWINSRIILGFIFFIVLTPIAAIMKMMRKDAMRRKPDPEAPSYRIESPERSINHMERPF